MLFSLACPYQSTSIANQPIPAQLRKYSLTTVPTRSLHSNRVSHLVVAASLLALRPCHRYRARRFCIAQGQVQILQSGSHGVHSLHGLQQGANSWLRGISLAWKGRAA